MHLHIICIKPSTLIHQEVARMGAVGDVGNRTGAGLGDHAVATLCDHRGDLCPRFEDAAGRRERLSTVAAAPADRGDLSAAPLRPDGIVAWAAAPGLPADTSTLATAPRTWLGEPHARTYVRRTANKVNLANLQAGKAPDDAEGRSDGARSTLTAGSALICPDAAERPARLRTGKTSEEQERRWHPIRQPPR
ncbi:hypothetical protein L1856_00445 [Streptomyces sp. Tue 6430]|nr:hypothetical protein [Streptomyces sp. Tue 6430]